MALIMERKAYAPSLEWAELLVTVWRIGDCVAILRLKRLVTPILRRHFGCSAHGDTHLSMTHRERLHATCCGSDAGYPPHPEAESSPPATFWPHSEMTRACLRVGRLP